MIPWPGRQPRVALACLAASNLVNLGFLLFDERMWSPEPLSGAALLAGALGYVAALPLVRRQSPSGYGLCLVLAPLASIVVVGDNFSAFGPAPNAATYGLNWAFFALQLPLAVASAQALRGGRGPAGPPTKS